MTHAPIVLFVYNRPEHTKQALESLRTSDLSRESELFIFADGPKDSDDELCRSAICRVREIAREKDWCGRVSLIEASINKGLACSIISGVSDIVNEYGRAIVLEDDLVISRYFLQYMNDALGLYDADMRVMHIAGYMFPVQGHLPETFFYRVPSCWGWATWQRAWSYFDEDAAKLLRAIEVTRRTEEFNIEGSMNYLDMLQLQANGMLDSWAIRWYASTFVNGGMCLHPGRSLVNNIGHDGSGKHCSMTERYNTVVSALPVRDFTKDITENKYAVEQIISYYAGMSF